MHSMTIDYDTFSIEEKIAVVVPVTSVAIAHSEVMLALHVITLSIK